MINKPLTLLIFLLPFLYCNAQDEELLIEESFEIEEEVPCKDFFAYDDSIYLQTLKHKIEVLDYTISDCDQSSNPYEITPRINISDSPLNHKTYNIQFSQNCCSGTIANLQVLNDKTWNFIINEDFDCGRCECNCCYTASFKIKNYGNNRPILFSLNQKELIVSDTVILRRKKSIEYWPNGNKKIITRLLDGKPHVKIHFNESEEIIMVEYFNNKGKLIRKKEKTEIDSLLKK